jgi:hypothetical protein
MMLETTADLAATVANWRDLWTQAGEEYAALPAEVRADIDRAGPGMDGLVAVFAAVDPTERAGVCDVLDRLIGVLDRDIRQVRPPRRCGH